MTIYEHHVTQYKAMRPTIDRLLRDKHLQGFLGKDAAALWKFIDGLFREKLLHKPGKRATFQHCIIFTGDFVKERTGMSKPRQRKALEILECVGLVSLHYFSGRGHYFRVVSYHYSKTPDFGFALYQHVAYCQTPYHFQDLLARIPPANNPFFGDPNVAYVEEADDEEDDPPESDLEELEALYTA